jgi:hypothetical protein
VRRCIELLLLVGFSLLLSLLLRTRGDQLHLWSNEAQAIGDTHAIISANQTYASANGGFYARNLECMARGSESGICIPGYPEDAPEFLGSDLARAVPYVKSGYERNYTTAEVPDEVPAGCDPASPRFFCYASKPVRLGVTGERSFLGTATGELYFDYDGGDSNCVPVARTAARGEDAPASIGPPPTAYPEGTPPPFSLRRTAGQLWQLVDPGSGMFVPTFLVGFVAYVIYRSFRRSG